MRMLLLGAALLVSAHAGEIEKLGFLSGCWAFEARGMVVEEQWNKPAGGMLLGAGRTLRGDRAVFHEFMRIDEKDGVIQYTPRIGGVPKPVSFRLIKLTETEAVFENLEHDFPQRIIYSKAPDGLPVRIEGTVNGVLKGQNFPFKRVACP